MAQLSWIQSKNTEWWQEAFSKAWLESDFKHKSVPRPSCTLPWHLHRHHENGNPASPLWLHATWKHCWGAQWFPKVQGASCPSQHSAIWLRSWALAIWPWFTHFISNLSKWWLYCGGKWGYYSDTYSQESLAGSPFQLEAAVPPPVSLRGMIHARVSLQGYIRIKTG